MDKGFFFTLLVFIFFFLVLVSITAWTRIQETNEEQIVVSIRIQKMNEFSTMLSEDAKRMSQLAAFNAIKAATTYVAFNNDTKYLNNSNCLERSCIYELMYNGTIGGLENYTKRDGKQVNLSTPDQMGNSILRKWDDQIKLLANRANFNVSIARDNIGVYQSDPWNVNIGYTLRFNVTDKALDTVFRREVVPILVTIPITNYTYGG